MQSSEDTAGDIALLDRIVARDAGAVGELYDRHSRLLFGLILRILKLDISMPCLVERNGRWRRPECGPRHLSCSKIFSRPIFTIP